MALKGRDVLGASRASGAPDHVVIRACLHIGALNAEPEEGWAPLGRLARKVKGGLAALAAVLVRRVIGQQQGHHVAQHALPEQQLLCSSDVNLDSMETIADWKRESQ